MPFARLILHPAHAPDTTSRLAADLTSAIAKDLGKRHELTSLLIETPASARWTIGAEDREVTAHLEVCVTAGTNSEEEKRIFVRNAMALLRRALPTLAEATYVVVTELPSVNWGYDGRTQADRATGLVPPGSA